MSKHETREDWITNTITRKASMNCCYRTCDTPIFMFKEDK
jgi:hypothetical protein